MCESLLSVGLGNNVSIIGENAFEGCKNLSSINIPSSVTSIGEYAFLACTSLNKVIIDDLASWCQIDFGDVWANPLRLSHHLYMNGNEVKEMVIPNTISQINDYAFYGCWGLLSAYIPQNVKSIGKEAFGQCVSMTTAEIPNSVNSIGESAFEECSSLLTVNIPDKLNYIKKRTFWGCSSLKSITIPSSIEIIYQEAFGHCNSLELINAHPTTPPIIYDNTFQDYSASVRVPKGCKNAYLTAQIWKNFANISDADKYKLIYVVDNEEYKTYEIEEGEIITPEDTPTKEGYTFSGWSDIPETMPANDVTVTGTFTINKYKLTYTVDGEEYKSTEVDYGSAITAETEPTKEGYTFSGWSDIPETMPAKDVTVTGTFTVNKYKLTYTVDGEEYKSAEVEYGSIITAETEPTKEGYTFSGWSDIPETMPAKDVTVSGTFTINKYKVTYIIDGEEYKTEEVEYGSTITPPNPDDREGFAFAWDDYPSTMPANDITITGSYTATAINAILAADPDVKIYTVSGKPINKLQKGVNILRYKDGRTKKIVIK